MKWHKFKEELPKDYKLIIARKTRELKIVDTVLRNYPNSYLIGRFVKDSLAKHNIFGEILSDLSYYERMIDYKNEDIYAETCISISKSCEICKFPSECSTFDEWLSLDELNEDSF